jgi:hypothetical protein
MVPYWLAMSVSCDPGGQETKMEKPILALIDLLVRKVITTSRTAPDHMVEREHRVINQAYEKCGSALRDTRKK